MQVELSGSTIQQGNPKRENRRSRFGSPTNSMIRHIVLMKCKADATQHHLDEMFAALKELLNILPGILAFEGGANNSPEQLSRGYTHAFSMDFADEETRERYLPHPAHKAAQEKMKLVLDDGDDCVLVLDFPIEPEESYEVYQTS